jgi:hypothetical protein
MHRALLIAGCLLAASGCSLIKKKTGSDGGGGGGGGKGWSEAFTEAPSYKLGTTAEVKAPPCSGSGFIKVDVEEDKVFHFTTNPSQAGSSCTYVQVLNGKSQTANTPKPSMDVCAETGPKTIESKGQPGGTWIEVQERYGCAGITVSIALADGPAPADAAEDVAPADGPTPEM